MAEWWRHGVLYEIYVRSFADANGDGVGDLEGIRSRLPYLRELGVDGVWLTPFYPSPGEDHGYDVSDYVDVDPQFGTLDDFDALLRDAHAQGLRVVIDIVPNHTSSEHRWFRNALSSRDHPDRARYVFRPSGNGTLPNNWPSTFGGPAWTLDESSGEYYLHLFAPGQPDLDWHNEHVQADFEEILRFWLDRGVDGFRIDVAHGLFKDASLADETEPFARGVYSSDWRRAIDQPELHPLYRRWRRLVDEYDGERVLVGEVVFSDPARVAPFTRPDELHQAFNFTLPLEPWDSDELADAIERCREAAASVGATPTWVLENHDLPRLTTRWGSERRARAAALLLLALPGTVYLYAGQELGLDEVDLPDELRQDPVFFRSHGERKGRDGCRVPIPWENGPPGFGFTTGAPWLPIPESWAEKTVERQRRDPSSTLGLYRRALERRPHGGFEWRASPAGTLAFERDGLACLVNAGAPRFDLPVGELVLASEPDVTDHLPPDTAAWVRPKR